MAKYFEITTDTQDITAVNGSPLSPTPDIATWLTTHPNWSLYTYNNDPSNYYTSLICPDHINNAGFSVDNTLNSQIFSGTPPQRPR